MNYTHDHLTKLEKTEYLEQGFCYLCGGQIHAESQEVGEACGLPTFNIVYICDQCEEVL